MSRQLERAIVEAMSEVSLKMSRQLERVIVGAIEERDGAEGEGEEKGKAIQRARNAVVSAAVRWAESLGKGNSSDWLAHLARAVDNLEAACRQSSPLEVKNESQVQISPCKWDKTQGTVVKVEDGYVVRDEKGCESKVMPTPEEAIQEWNEAMANVGGDGEDDAEGSE